MSYKATFELTVMVDIDDLKGDNILDAAQTASMITQDQLAQLISSGDVEIFDSKNFRMTGIMET